jgi:hypothetical protein
MITRSAASYLTGLPLAAYTEDVQQFVRVTTSGILRFEPGIHPQEVDANVVLHYAPRNTQPAPYSILLPLVQREVAFCTVEATCKWCGQVASAPRHDFADPDNHASAKHHFDVK